VDFEVEG
jgi:hypothetical protein